MIIRSDVVLPAPLGPINPYSAPLGTTRSRSRTATVVPNVLLTPLSEIAGSMESCSEHEVHGAEHAHRGPDVVELQRLLHIQHQERHEDGQRQHLLQNLQPRKIEHRIADTIDHDG